MNLEASIGQLAQQGHRASGPALEIGGSSPLALGDTTRVEVELTQLGGELVDENGEVVQTADGGREFVYVLTVSREGDEWLVDEITIQE